MAHLNSPPSPPLASLATAEARFGRAKTVAVIGAGISGVCTTAHLLKQGLSVTVFERSTIPGGVWHYDDRASEDPPYPNQVPSLGDYRVSKRGEHAVAAGPTPPATPERRTVNGTGGTIKEGEEKEVEKDPEVSFSPPGPCYAGLKTNVPTTLMRSTLGSWPEGTGEFTSQQHVELYVQTLAKNHGVQDVTLFQTRVDEVRKTADNSKWEVRSVTLIKTPTPHLVERISLFDLVVVASGHYNNPRIPEIPGLKQWKAAFPSRVIHSKQYRNPEHYRGQNLLVIGAGVSSVDICRELDGVAAKAYQSVRGGSFDLPASMLPPSAERVAEVAEFVLQDSNQDNISSSSSSREETPRPIPGTAILKDGRVLHDIHQVVLGTGYITSYPFLSQLHNDTAHASEVNGSATTPSTLVSSDGEMAHNLHKDIFWMADPTLAFIGVPYYVATFSLFDFQAQALARVFAGAAKLPALEEMRREYQDRVNEKGLGRGLHSLYGPNKEIEYVQDLVDWVNEGVADEQDKMLPHDEEWVRKYEEVKANRVAVFGESTFGQTKKKEVEVEASQGVVSEEVKKGLEEGIKG
ncbi:hypothetical protein B0T17DRAFT_614007 [Bombardia bombarda]|uniref:FAD dependent oxidoreductase domain-containing protein n=1 Tax=Bombardia bombarda TaxID=252184 RepID=A0AA39XNR1_9PEZI|nr:hypothetical protein B0T17DRAFT_614007 [Bombardia bombarda]